MVLMVCALGYAGHLHALPAVPRAHAATPRVDALRGSGGFRNTLPSSRRGVCAFDRDYLGRSRPPPLRAPRGVAKDARFVNQGARACGAAGVACRGGSFLSMPSPRVAATLGAR